MSKHPLIRLNTKVIDIYSYSLPKSFSDLYTWLGSKDIVIITFINQKLNKVEKQIKGDITERVQWILNDVISAQIKYIEQTYV